HTRTKRDWSSDVCSPDLATDSQVLSYSVVANPTHGTLTSFNSSTGAFSYTPAADYHGPDSFTFKANDGTVDSNTATVSITVTARSEERRVGKEENCRAER